MKTTPESPRPTSVDDEERGDKGAFGNVFGRLVALATEILPGQRTRQDLETRMGLPATRISKDVRSLAELGISIGRSGHRYVVEANRFPVLVGVEETRALELAHHVLVRAGLPEADQLRQILDRVPEVVRAHSSEGLAEAGGIEFPPASIESHAFAREIDELRKIIRSGRMLRISYLSRRAAREAEGPSMRLLDRAELIFQGTVYLNAWEVREDGSFQGRTFRVDRIGRIEPLATPVSKPAPPVFEYVYRLSATMAEMATCPPGSAVRRLDDGSLEIRAAAKTDLLARMHVLRYGPDAEVIEPLSLREAVADALAQGAARYGNTARRELQA